ncbi:MAG: outer membrane protein assembly factor BamA [Verrucomicrobiota bacterium]|jgi:outer membrane protein insertion porin family
MSILFCRHGLWGWLVLALLCPVWAQQPGLPVQKIEIRHVGPPAASDALIRANIKIKVGDVYTRTGVDDDVRSLYATGLFYNIRVAEERSPQGVTLTYVVQGKPTLTDIRFEGNEKYSRRKLLRKVTSKIGEPLNERKLFSDAQEIQKMYQKSGRQRTEVKYDLNIEEATGKGTVTFKITEAPKVKIEDVEFVGAQAFTQRKLRKTIKTRRHWMFSWLTGSGVLKDEQFEDDKEKLAAFYHDEGYIDFELKDVQFDYTDPKHMVLRFIIFEGVQYKVGSVEFKGNSVFKSEDIARSLRMGVGQVFSPKKLQEDIEHIRDFYGARGYIDTWVRPIRYPNTERGTMDLVYQIMDEDKGVSYIEKIEIRGNTKTKDKVIRRELAVSPGEVFNMVRVKLSKARLEQMTFFDKVETDDEPTDVPNRKNLVLDVQEASTGHFELGAGFSSVDNLVGFVGYREGNFDLLNPPYFRGGGQKLRVNLQLGTRRKDFQISFVEPWFLDRKLMFGTDLYFRELNFYSSLYDVSQIGGKVSLSKALWSDFVVGNVSYTIEEIGILDVDPRAPQFIRDEEGHQLVSKIGTGVAWDTRNSVLLPDRGQRTEFTTELAGGPFGGDTDFYKLELRSSWYFPGFAKGHVWEIGGRAGVVDNYGRSDRVHLFDRFFLGGVYSLRGYKYRQVGPHRGTEVTSVNPDGTLTTELVDPEPIGGETFWFSSIEYSIPIIERLRFALFYDIGNVYENAYSFDLADEQKIYNDNWGVGIRLNIPRLGPLRLDYGVPITHDQFSDGGGRFQFSVGFSRDY